jgi:hypothetical protein
MNKQIFPYSRLYVHAQTTLRELNDFVLRSIDGQMDRSTIVMENINIQVMTNDEFDLSKVDDLKEGFLSYRYTFEIWQSGNESSRIKFSAILSKLLIDLWAHNVPAIACYEFEEDLPEKGGYLSSNVPRPGKA